MEKIDKNNLPKPAYQRPSSAPLLRKASQKKAVAEI
jgi:hypothetical protein